MATFGYITVGASFGNGGLGEGVIGCFFALTEEADVTKISLYTENTATGADVRVKGLLYSDNAGYPNALLGTSNSTTINSATPQWWDLTFASPVHLTSGNYWISYVEDDFMSYYFDAGSANQTYQKGVAGVYATPPNPFSASATGVARKLSIYATYTPITASGTISNQSLLGVG